MSDPLHTPASDACARDAQKSSTQRVLLKSFHARFCRSQTLQRATIISPWHLAYSTRGHSCNPTEETTDRHAMSQPGPDQTSRAHASKYLAVCYMIVCYRDSSQHSLQAFPFHGNCCILRVMSDILKAANQQQVTLLGLLDLSAAFDCVDRKSC